MAHRIASSVAIAAVVFCAVRAEAADDSVVLGAAVSLTGKYAVNGKNTKDGYDLAVERINEMGGVRIARKTYKLSIVYYDDESTPARGAHRR